MIWVPTYSDDNELGKPTWNSYHEPYEIYRWCLIQGRARKDCLCHLCHCGSVGGPEKVGPHFWKFYFRSSSKRISFVWVSSFVSSCLPTNSIQLISFLSNNPSEKPLPHPLILLTNHLQLKAQLSTALDNMYQAPGGRLVPGRSTHEDINTSDTLQSTLSENFIGEEHYSHSIIFSQNPYSLLEGGWLHHLCLPINVWTQEWIWILGRNFLLEVPVQKWIHILVFTSY